MDNTPRTIEELERLAKDIIALNTPDSDTPRTDKEVFPKEWEAEAVDAEFAEN